MRRFLIAFGFVLFAVLVGRVIGQGDEITKLVAQIKDPATTDTDQRVAVNKLVALAQQNPKAVEACVDLAGDPVAGKHVPFAMSTFLEKQHLKPHVPAIIKLLDDPKLSAHRGNFLRILEKAEVDPKLYLDQMIAIIKDKGDGKVFTYITRWGTVQRLGKLGSVAKPAMPALLEALKDGTASKEKTLCKESIKAIMKVDPSSKEALEAFRSLREDPDGEVKKLASKACWVLGDEPEKMAAEAKRLATVIKTSRTLLGPVEAGRELQEYGPRAKVALPELIDALENAQNRGIACEVLASIGPDAKEAVPKLVPILEDKTKWKNDLDKILIALDNLNADPKEVLPGLVELMKDGLDPQGKFPIRGFGYSFHIKAARLLTKMGPEAKTAVPTLSAFAKKTRENNMPAGEEAIKALGAIGPDAKEAVPWLLERVKGNPNGTQVERDALAKITGKKIDGPDKPKDDKPKDDKPKDDKPKDDKPKDDKPKDDKPKDPDKPANPELLKGLNDRDPDARGKALEKLAKMGAEGVPTLQAGLKSNDPEARANILGTLGKLGTNAKAAVPGIAAALKDPSLTVRRQAAATLAALGPDAKEAVEALTEALKDPDRETRLLAAYALEKISP